MKNIFFMCALAHFCLVFPLHAQEDVIWTDLIGVTASGNTITKTTTKRWGNAGAASLQILPANTNGWMEIEVSQISTYRLVGFSSNNSNASYNSINFAFYLTGNSSLRILEDGVFKEVIGSYSSGDKLRLERVNSQILYKKNGITLHTSTVINTGVLVVDAALYTTGAKIENAVIYIEGAAPSEQWIDSNSHIYRENPVLIGPANTSLPTGYNLYVTQGLMTEKAKVALSSTASWSDYVFEEDYHLNNLEFIEEFSKKNKHLPHMPSAKELKQTGIDVVTMDANLLRQIEELWLHVFELNKQNTELKNEINHLKTTTKSK